MDFNNNQYLLNYNDDVFVDLGKFFIKDKNSKSTNDKMKYPPFNLLQDSNDLSVIKYLPRNFELKTNNTSGKFNLDLLISNEISDLERTQIKLIL